MIQFKLNGKKVQVASSWDDLTFEQFYETFNFNGDFLKAVSIVTGLNYEILKDAKIEGLESVITAMSFLRQPAKWDQPVFKCGPYELPANSKGQFDIQFESLGQFEDLRVILQKLAGKPAKEMAEQYPSMVSIYLQKIRDGKYDPNKAKEMESEVRTYPAREVVSLASFFIVKLSTLLTGTAKDSPNTSKNPKKKKPVSAGSKKPLGRSPRSRK